MPWWWFFKWRCRRNSLTKVWCASITIWCLVSKSIFASRRRRPDERMRPWGPINGVNWARRLLFLKDLLSRRSFLSVSEDSPWTKYWRWRSASSSSTGSAMLPSTDETMRSNKRSKLSKAAALLKGFVVKKIFSFSIRGLSLNQVLEMTLGFVKLNRVGYAAVYGR